MLARFYRAVGYIERNLDRPIRLNEVAAAANYSPYHFSRMFKAMTGDSVTEYVRRRRLTVAADRLLADGEISLMQLALDVGFESQESFTKAFKSMFNVTPGNYRKNKDPMRLLYRDPYGHSEHIHLSYQLEKEPEIITRPGMKVVGMAHNFVDRDLSLKEVWSGFKPEMDGVPNRVGKLGFGIYEAYYEAGEEVGFTYWCAVEVNNFDEVPEGFQAREIPEQQYAVFLHRGPLPNLHKTLKYIWGSWLPKSKYEYVSSPELEIYPANYVATEKDAELQLYIPVSLQP